MDEEDLRMEVELLSLKIQREVKPGIPGIEHLTQKAVELNIDKLGYEIELERRQSGEVTEKMLNHKLNQLEYRRDLLRRKRVDGEDPDDGGEELELEIESIELSQEEIE